MRRLTATQIRDLADYDRTMAAIQRDRDQASARPRRPAGTRPASPARRVAPPGLPSRPVGYADGRPHRVCRACHEPAHLVARTGMCPACAAEVTWRVLLAQRGLRVVR